MRNTIVIGMQLKRIEQVAPREMGLLRNLIEGVLEEKGYQLSSDQFFLPFSSKLIYFLEGLDPNERFPLVEEIEEVINEFSASQNRRYFSTLILKTSE